jgi:hypothetical protein
VISIQQQTNKQHTNSNNKMNKVLVIASAFLVIMVVQQFIGLVESKPKILIKPPKKYIDLKCNSINPFGYTARVYGKLDVTGPKGQYNMYPVNGNSLKIQLYDHVGNTIKTINNIKAKGDATNGFGCDETGQFCNLKFYGTEAASAGLVNMNTYFKIPSKVGGLQSSVNTQSEVHYQTDCVSSLIRLKFIL